MCMHSIHTSYCVAQQQPPKPGNLPVQKKATHIIPPAPGASKVTKLASGDHFVYCIFFCGHMEQVMYGGSNSQVSGAKNVSEIRTKWLERGPRGSPRAHTR